MLVVTVVALIVPAITNVMESYWNWREAEYARESECVAHEILRALSEFKPCVAPPQFEQKAPDSTLDGSSFP